MKKNMDSFAIYPLVVLEGQRTTVTVVSKMSCDGTESGIDYWGKQRSGGPFTTKKQYSVKVTPREIHYPETKAQKEIGYTVENGSLVFEYTFYGEQEYMVFIDEVVEGVNTRLTFFKLYSVKEDLYRLLPWKGALLHGTMHKDD
jgi:hypothetical protein